MTHPHIPTLTQVTAPAEEPVTLAEAKAHLRVDSSDDDAMITRLIAASRRAAENYMRRSLVTQSWKLSFDDYAPAEILLPRGPVQSVTSVKIVARDSTETAVSASTYYLSASKEKLVLSAAPIGHRVEIVYVAGFGGASAVPEEIKQGLLAHAAGLYEHRSGDMALTLETQKLYDIHRAVWL